MNREILLKLYSEPINNKLINKDDKEKEYIKNKVNEKINNLFDKNIKNEKKNMNLSEIVRFFLENEYNNVNKEKNKKKTLKKFKEYINIKYSDIIKNE